MRKRELVRYLAMRSRELFDNRPLAYRYAREDLVNSILVGIGERPLTDEQLLSLRDECRDNAALRDQFESVAAPALAKLQPDKPRLTWDERFLYKNGMHYANVDCFYVLPRVLKPNILIETGVATGASTSLHLAALHKNGAGKLISIDLPPVDGRGGMNYTADPKHRAILVPDSLKGPWEFITGDCTQELPKLSGPVDLFMHDSDHSYAHMMFEYAWAAKAGAKVVVSDDISGHEAFFQFFKTPISHARNPNIGAAVA